MTHSSVHPRKDLVIHCFLSSFDITNLRLLVSTSSPPCSWFTLDNSFSKSSSLALSNSPSLPSWRPWSAAGFLFLYFQPPGFSQPHPPPSWLSCSSAGTTSDDFLSNQSLTWGFGMEHLMLALKSPNHSLPGLNVLLDTLSHDLAPKG